MVKGRPAASFASRSGVKVDAEERLTDGLEVLDGDALGLRRDAPLRSTAFISATLGDSGSDSLSGPAPFAPDELRNMALRDRELLP